jgi:hypothetical protein
MVQTGNQIDSEWSMFIVVHLGLFWFFFLVHRPLLVFERLVALFAYGAFAFINANALKYAYAFLEATRSDLVTRFANELSSTPNMAAILSGTNFGDRGDLLMLTHGGAFVIVSILLIFRNVIIRRYERAFPQRAPAAGGLLG